MKDKVQRRVQQWMEARKSEESDWVRREYGTTPAMDAIDAGCAEDLPGVGRPACKHMYKNSFIGADVLYDTACDSA